MNCIDCEWSIQWDKDRQCKRADPKIKECEWFKRAKKEVTNERYE